MRLMCLLLQCILGCSAVFQRVSLQNNAYKGILVAISPSVFEDPSVVQAIKETITNASNNLFIATHKRAHFGDVTILLPSTWNGKYEVTDGFSHNLADVVVANANPVYGDTPYTLQYGQCGEPGSYIHLTPDYLREDSFVNEFGPRGKTFVHEWAHLRWGVYDEASTEGYEGFYVDAHQNVQATRCPLGLKGRHMFFPPDDPHISRICQNDPYTGLPEPGCVFVPNSDQNVNTSLMSHHFVEQSVEFCDDHNHNTEAPNKHNIMCGNKSVWSVIRSSVDFNNTNFPNHSIIDVTPKFTVFKALNDHQFVDFQSPFDCTKGEKSCFQGKLPLLEDNFVNSFLHAGVSRAAFNPESVKSDGNVVANSKGNIRKPGNAMPYSYTGRASGNTTTSNITDLKAEQIDVNDLSRGIRLTFTAPGSDTGEAANGYDIRYNFNSEDDLTNNYGTSTLVAQNHVLEGSIFHPNEPGKTDNIVVTLISVPQGQDKASVWFAMKAYFNMTVSEISNIAETNLTLVPETTGIFTTTTTLSQTSTETSDIQKKLESYQLATLILTISCSILVCALISTIIMQYRLNKQREKLLSQHGQDTEGGRYQVKEAWAYNECKQFKYPEKKSSS